MNLNFISSSLVQSSSAKLDESKALVWPMLKQSCTWCTPERRQWGSCTVLFCTVLYCTVQWGSWDHWHRLRASLQSGNFSVRCFTPHQAQHCRSLFKMLFGQTRKQAGGVRRWGAVVKLWTKSNINHHHHRPSGCGGRKPNQRSSVVDFNTFAYSYFRKRV